MRCAFRFMYEFWHRIDAQLIVKKLRIWTTNTAMYRLEVHKLKLMAIMFRNL